MILVITSLCKTTSQKLNALFRVSANTNSDKCSLLIIFFIKMLLQLLSAYFGKCLNGLLLDVMDDVLENLKHRCNTRHYNLFVTDRPKTNRYGQSSIPYRANQILNSLSHEIKNSANLDSFKLKSSIGVV